MIIPTGLTKSWFRPILAGASFGDRLLGCLGALIGIALTGYVCARTISAASPMLVAPVGASAVLLFAVPASPLAQPWSIMGGNVISALVGVLVVQLGAPVMLSAGLAVGGAIMAMSVLRCLHPPGGAAALTAVIGGSTAHVAGFAFPLVPVGINSALLVLLGIAFHRFSGHSYPHRAIPVSGHVLVDDAPHLLDRGDVDLALHDIGETFDIAREDLELLFHRVEVHAAERRRREANQSPGDRVKDIANERT